MRWFLRRALIGGRTGVKQPPSPVDTRSPHAVCHSGPLLPCRTFFRGRFWGPQTFTGGCSARHRLNAIIPSLVFPSNLGVRPSKRLLARHGTRTISPHLSITWDASRGKVGTSPRLFISLYIPRVLHLFPLQLVLSSACARHSSSFFLHLFLQQALLSSTLTMAPGMTNKRAYNWYVSLVAASCMVLYGYDASVYNAVQGSTNWKNYFGNPDTEKIGAVNTAYTVGAIVAGWFMGGPLADYAGRRVGMAVGALLTIVATFIQTFSPRGNIGTFIAGRVIIGLGQGLALTAGPIYIGELAPPEIRGKIMTFWQMFYSVGSFIAYWVNYACTKNVKKLGEWDWKMVVIFQMLVPILIIAQVFFIPESPRWLIKRRGDIEGARAALRRVRDSEQDVEDEVLMVREAIEYENEAISSNYSALWEGSLRAQASAAGVCHQRWSANYGPGHAQHLLDHCVQEGV